MIESGLAALILSLLTLGGGGLFAFLKWRREGRVADQVGTIAEYQKLLSMAHDDNKTLKADVEALREELSVTRDEVHAQTRLLERVLERNAHLEWLLKTNNVAFQTWNPSGSTLHPALPPEAPK